MAKTKYADIVINRYKKARDLFAPVAERVEINRNLYKGFISTDDQYEWDYSLVDQQVFPLIRNYIARTNPSMTKIRLEARKPEDFEKRQVNQDLINWEINELDLANLLVRAFFSNFLAGKAYFKTGWKYQPRLLIQNGDYKYEMRPIINRADMKFVRFNNLLVPNRNIPTLKDQPYTLELMQLSPGEMIKDNETFGYEYWDKRFISKLRKGGVNSKALDYEAEFVQDADTMDEMTFRAATFPVVCMHTQDGEVFYVPLFEEQDRVINKDTENPYWHGHYPYIDMTAFPEDDEYFAMSVVDAVGDFQIAGTEVLNQTLTNIRSINNGMWITGADQATTPDYMFKQRPSGVIRVVGDPNDIVQIRPIDSTRSMLAMGQEISTKFEKVGGISSLYSSGAADKTINQTARGAQVIDKNIDTNVQMILDLFGEQVLKEMGNHFQELNAQYITEEQSFAITGKRGVRELVTISPDLVSANFDVYTYPEAMVKQTPASRQASLQNLTSVLNSEAPKAGVQIDMVPIFENLIDAYPETENIDDIVVSIDEKAKRDIAMLKRGQMPEIKVRDAHMELVQICTVDFEENQADYTPETAALYEKYVQKHMRFMEAQQMIAQMTKPAPDVNQSLNYRDAPPDVQRQIEQSAGYQPSNVPPADNMGTGQPNGYNLGNIAGQ